jgi:hypothetical protein
MSKKKNKRGRRRATSWCHLKPTLSLSVSLFQNKKQNKRRKKEERIRWVAFWVDAHFEMYTMGARACVVEQRTQVVWVYCCCHKVESTEGFCTQHQPSSDV